VRGTVAEQTHLVLPQRRGVRAGRRHRLRSGGVPLVVRAPRRSGMLPFRETNARRVTGERMKENRACRSRTRGAVGVDREVDWVRESIIHFLVSHMRVSLKISQTERRSRKRGRLLAAVEIFRKRLLTARRPYENAHFTRAARSHTHPSHYRLPSSRVRHRTRTHARSVDAASTLVTRGAFFSRQVEDLISGLLT
jgi:hypothetical protein